MTTITSLTQYIRSHVAVVPMEERPAIVELASQLASSDKRTSMFFNAALAVKRRLEGTGPKKPPGFITECEENASEQLYAALRLARALRRWANSDDREIAERIIAETAKGAPPINWKAIRAAVQNLAEDGDDED